MQRTCAVLATALTVGCTSQPTATLSELSNLSVSVMEQESGNVTFDLIYAMVLRPVEHDCAEIAGLQATLNGVPFTDIERGRWNDDRLADHYCSFPQGTLDAALVPRGDAITLRLEDASAVIELDAPTLMAARAMRFAGGIPAAIHPGDTLTFQPMLAAGDVDVRSSIDAFIPDDRCAHGSVFHAMLEPAGANYQMVVPTLESPFNYSCPGPLVAGRAELVEVTVALWLTPAIARCEGAEKCGASWSKATVQMSSYVP